MSGDFEINWNELNIKKDFTADDVAIGKVNYELSEYRADLYEKINAHITPQKANEIYVHMIGEMLLFSYFMEDVAGKETTLKELMRNKTYTRHLGKVELKKMLNQTENNNIMYQAIIFSKISQCKAMSMDEAQINKSINNYVQKEIFGNFLSSKQRKSFSRKA